MKLTQKIITDYIKNINVNEKGKQTRLNIYNQFKGIELDNTNLSAKFNKLYKDKSVNTQNTYKTYINALINELNSIYDLGIKPLKKIRIAKCSKETLLDSDYKVLVNNVLPKYKATLQVQYYLALRVTELTLIEWEQLANQDSIKINNKGTLRELPIPEIVKDIAKGRKGKVLQTTTNSYNRHLKHVASKYLDKDVTTHLIRHYRANTLRKNNIDVYTIKEVLGHADIKTTEIYLDVDMKDKRKALELI